MHASSVSMDLTLELFIDINLPKKTLNGGKSLAKFEIVCLEHESCMEQQLELFYIARILVSHF